MGASDKSIQAGVVYETKSGRERRVWTVRDGRVHYFERPRGGGAYWTPGHPPHQAPTVEAFAAEVRQSLNGAPRSVPLLERSFKAVGPTAQS